MTIQKGLILGIGSLILVLIVFLKPLRFIDNIFYDLNFVFAAQNAADSVVVVGLDNKSISEIGAIPWPRAKLADLVEKISAGNPRALGLDISLPYRDDRINNDSLAAVFSRTKNLVLPFRITGISSENSNDNTVPPNVFNYRFLKFINHEKLDNLSFFSGTGVDASDTMFTKYAQYGGFFNTSTSNSSQKLRETIQILKIGQEYFPSFGIAAVAAYYSLSPGELTLDGNGTLDLSHRIIPISSYAATSFINFRNQTNAIKEFPATDVINGRVTPDIFRGKLVLIGVTDPLASSDFFTTPVGSQFPGVSMWANIALDILQGIQVKTNVLHLSLLNWLLVFLLFPGLGFLFPANKKILSLLVSCGILLCSIGTGILLFKHINYYWETTSHIYAWFFSLIWLSTLSAKPSLGEAFRLSLEPPENLSDDTLPPPTDEELLTALPMTETAKYVTSTTTPKATTTPVTTSNQTRNIKETLAENFNPNIVQPESATTSLETTDITDKTYDLAGGKIVRVLGTGGMADVYLVWNPRMEVYRAVKVIKSSDTANFFSRFETEIRIIAKLDHQNIVQCYGVGEWHSLPYLEMEYVRGVSLEEVLTKCKTISVEQALGIGVLVCRALHYAHNQVITIYNQTYKGIVHRDLKPANIMLSKCGRVKLTDFGIARPTSTSLHTTDTGNIVGTLPYLAPEQLGSGELTGGADLYALGATLYEMMTGQPTFPQTEIPALLHAKSLGTYKPLNNFISVSDEVVRVINKALSIDVTQRYQTALELGRDLEKVLLQTSGPDGYKHIDLLLKRIWNT